LKGAKTMNYDNQYWEDRFILKGYPELPEKVKRAIKRVYEAYPKECMPQGLCDPAYIMNIICFELGIGDGQGNFNI
jgi:hypothetical protein